jgi:membrane protease YdiL (CAAX protease family)
VRWGIGDFLWIWPTGIVVSVVLASIGYGVTGDDLGEPGALTTALAAGGQFGTWFVAMALVARAKGRSLRSDFGLVVRARDGWAVFAGMGVYLLAVVLVLPLVAMVDENQEVVDELLDASGPKLAVLAVTAGLLAPVCEELLFRGLLLRAVRRRYAPVVAVGFSAAVFAFVHPLLDQSLGTFARSPAFLALGIVSGIAAVRTRDLSVPILLHVGFNLLTVVGALA